MQSTYKYRFDHSTIYWTLIYIIVFVLLGGLLYHLYEGGYLSAWFTSFIVALVALMSLSIPRKIVVSDETVEVRCLLDITEIRRDEIASVLGAPSTVDVPQQCGNLFRVLATDPFSTVDLANSIWMAKDASFEQSFIDTAIGQFYATPFSVEFGTDAADQAMAAWISENTGGTIDPQVKTESDLLLSIINAVYFKGGWMDTFDAANTAPAVFHAASGDVETQFMTQRIDSLQGFRQTDDFLRARLAFTGGTMMTFVLPAEGVSVDDLLADEQRLAQAFAVDANEDEYGFITYVVPKVAFDTELDLIPALERLGMKTPFSDKADFSNLTATPAFISMVKQESHISWDEEGAEASAYTDMGISATSAMIPEGEEVELRLDRPFLFQITSSQGIPLFMGVCGNPAA